MKSIPRLLAAVGIPVIGILIFAACASGASETPPAPAAPAAPAPATSPTSDGPQSAAPAVPSPAQETEPVTPSEPSNMPEESGPSEMAEIAESSSIVMPRTGNEDMVPEIRGITSWINSEPFTLEEQRGKVVLIDFWTYTCVNCIRTLPYLKSWHEKYADKGLVIVGVHSPEFEFEKDRDNVIEAVEDFGLEWAVVQDNDFETWRAFNNRFWPAKYFVDKDGFIRFTHFGEGAYDESESWIRGLLEEAGADLSDITPHTIPEPLRDSAALDVAPGSGQTRELYAGYERNIGTLLSRSAPPYILAEEYFDNRDGETLYIDPGDYQNHFIYLQGLWHNGPESLTHARETMDFEDYLAIKFFATSVNVVMAPADGNALEVRVTLNDAPLIPSHAGADVMFDDQGNSYVTVDQSRMYNIVNLQEFGGHELKLSSNSPELSVFAYTFGSYEGGEPAKTGPNG